MTRRAHLTRLHLRVSWLLLLAALVACGEGGGDALHSASGGRAGSSGQSSSGGMTASGGASGEAGTSNAGAAGMASTDPPELGKACSGGDDCGHELGCDVVSGTCVWPCATFEGTSRTEPCADGDECVIQAPRSPSVCFTPCTPGSCLQGFVCDRNGRGPACLRAGTALLGMPCEPTQITTGCASDDLSCREGICARKCDSNSLAPTCPTGEQCIQNASDGYSTCTSQGDSASLGQQCSLPEGSVCGSDGALWRGSCEADGECLASCGANDSDVCPKAQACVRSRCRTPCNPLDASPGCPSPEQCTYYGYCSSAAGDPAAVGEPCSKLLCASDGKGFRGLCESLAAGSICASLCATAADCTGTEACSDGVCIPDE